MFPKDSDMQNLYHDYKPDPLERKIRFGCGFIFGLIIGFFGFARIVYESAGLVVRQLSLLLLYAAYFEIWRPVLASDDPALAMVDIKKLKLIIQT
jgi:hypothetical protein